MSPLRRYVLSVLCVPLLACSCFAAGDIVLGDLAGVRPTWQAAGGNNLVASWGSFDAPWAIYFPGPFSYGAAPDSASLSVTGNITIACWAKFLPTTSVRRLVYKRNAVSGYDFATSTGHKLQFAVYWSGTVLSYNTSSTSIDDNNWHHCAGVFNSATRSVSVYVDGLKETGASLSSATNMLDITNAVYLATSGGSTWGFTGSVDEVAIWQRPLTSNEIFALASATQYISSGSITDSIVALWHADEGSGSTASDFSGLGNPITLFSGATWTNGIVPIP